MTAALHADVRHLPRDGRGPRPVPRTARWLLSTLVVLALATLVAIVPGLSSGRRGVRALPDEQRLALLSRTVDELRQFCGEGRADLLADHCRDLASFAAQFDECRGECEALVHRQLTPIPSR